MNEKEKCKICRVRQFWLLQMLVLEVLQQELLSVCGGGQGMCPRQNLSGPGDLWYFPQCFYTVTFINRLEQSKKLHFTRIALIRKIKLQQPLLQMRTTNQTFHRNGYSMN